MYPAQNFDAHLLCFHRFGPTLGPDDDLARFGATDSLFVYENRSERTRRKRLRAETLGIRSQTTQDAYKHPPVAYRRHILIKNGPKPREPPKPQKIMYFSVYFHVFPRGNHVFNRGIFHDFSVYRGFRGFLGFLNQI